MKCSISDLEIDYDIIGSGYPLLMLHGLSLDHRVLSGSLEPIFTKRKGFQRIYLDLPGMGKTPGVDWIKGSMEMLKVLSGFIEQVLPGKHFAIVGQSYGGYLARGLLQRLPQRIDGMMLVSPVVHFARSKRNTAVHKVLRKDPALLAELSLIEAEYFQSSIVLQTRPVWERFRQQILPGIQLADISFIERIRDIELSFQSENNPRLFQGPVTVLMARFDSVVGYKDGLKFYSDFPRATLVLFDSAGHYLQVEQPALFNAAALNWISRLRRAVKNR